MTLTGPNGIFELNILDYEYSDSRDFLDRNWLIVSLITIQGLQRSVRTLTYLSTWELELLHDWLQSVIDHAALAPRLTFIEPSLSFSNCSGEKEPFSFRIRMADGAAPVWHEDAVNPFWLPVAPNRAELQTAITDLAAQLQKFPIRD